MLYHIYDHIRYIIYTYHTLYDHIYDKAHKAVMFVTKYVKGRCNSKSLCYEVYAKVLVIT